MSQLLKHTNIHIQKCTGKSSSTCMTARGDNDEGLSSITIRSTFDKVSKRMSWYEYVYVGAVHELYISMKGHTSGSAQSQFRTYYKLHSRFLHFRKIRLVISSTRGVMFNLFKPCLHFVGCCKQCRSRSDAT